MPLPPLPQPKHRQSAFDGVMTRLAFASSWNGQLIFHLLFPCLCGSWPRERTRASRSMERFRACKSICSGGRRRLFGLFSAIISRLSFLLDKAPGCATVLSHNTGVSPWLLFGAAVDSVKISTADPVPPEPRQDQDSGNN